MPPIKSQDNNRRHFRLFYLTPFLFSKIFMHQKKPDTSNIIPKHVSGKFYHAQTILHSEKSKPKIPGVPASPSGVPAFANRSSSSPLRACGRLKGFHTLTHCNPLYSSYFAFVLANIFNVDYMIFTCYYFLYKISWRCLCAELQFTRQETTFQIL